MVNFNILFQWYNNKDVVPILESMQKKIELYQDKRNDMLNLECRLPNLESICVHKSKNHKLYTFFEGEKDLCEKT